MVARLLLFIKHKIPLLWVLVDSINAKLFRLLHYKRMMHEAARAVRTCPVQGFDFLVLEASDLDALADLIERQKKRRLRHFRPHAFGHDGLKKAMANPSFIMFGVYEKNLLVGYFFLRCFWNRKCFVGRLIDEPFERRGIGRGMNEIMYKTAWRSGFRCMTTVSRENSKVIRSHRNNPHARVIGDLGGDYVWVEFLENNSKNDGLGI